MTLKTRKKHRNQSKETQDRPRLDPGPGASRQSSRQQQGSVQQGNRSGAGSSGGGDEYTVGGDSGAGNASNSGRGNY